MQDILVVESHELTATPRRLAGYYLVGTFGTFDTHGLSAVIHAFLTYERCFGRGKFGDILTYKITHEAEGYYSRELRHRHYEIIRLQQSESVSDSRRSLDEHEIRCFVHSESEFLIRETEFLFTLLCHSIWLFEGSSKFLPLSQVCVHRHCFDQLEIQQKFDF